MQIVTGPVPDGQTVIRTVTGDQVPQHGTGVLSQIAGATKGVATKVNVHLQEVSLNQDQYFLVLNLDLVNADWRTRAPRSPTPLAVVNLSWGLHKINTDVGIASGLQGQLRSLISAGVVPVISTGNSGTVSNTHALKIFECVLNICLS